MEAIQTIQVELVAQTLQEAVQVFLGRIAPLQFAEGSDARHHLPLHLQAVLGPLRPDASLHADDVVLLLVGQLGDGRLEVVHALNAAHTLQAVVARIAEVQVADGADDGLVTQLGCLDRSGNTRPGGNGGRFGVGIAFEDFIPSQHLLAALGNFLLHLAHEVHLELVLLAVLLGVAQAEFADLGLALRALLPFSFRALVATYMYIRCIGEDVHQFVDHVLGELQSFVIASAKHFLEHAELCRHLIRAARATQFGIRGQRGQHVSRHVDFGDDGDEAFGSVCHDFLRLFLRIESLDGRTVEFAGTGRGNGLLTDGADLR